MIWRVLGFLVIAAAFWAIQWRAARSREIVVLSVERGRTRVIRGHAPPSLIEALRDVFARGPTQRALVKVVRAEGRPQLWARGLDDNTLQRARNVLGTYPAHRLMPLPK